MKRAAILALTTLALAACGPDDQASVSVAQTATNTSLPASAVEPLVLPAAADEAASNPIAAAQTSLAADAQQVTPVMHSAPDATQ